MPPRGRPVQGRAQPPRRSPQQCRPRRPARPTTNHSPPPATSTGASAMSAPRRWPASATTWSLKASSWTPAKSPPPYPPPPPSCAHGWKACPTCSARNWPPSATKGRRAPSWPRRSNTRSRKRRGSSTTSQRTRTREHHRDAQRIRRTPALRHRLPGVAGIRGAAAGGKDHFRCRSRPRPALVVADAGGAGCRLAAPRCRHAGARARAQPSGRSFGASSMTAAAAPRIHAAIARAIAPRKPLTVSQWADAERVLSAKGSAEPGRWRTHRNPPLREPMDCLSARSTVQDIVCMFPIQFGKTEIAVNGLGYTMDHNPGPVMVCLPGEVGRDKWVAQKLNPMLEETPAAHRALTSVASRDSSNTRTFKDFAGGQLYLEHAGSPSRLKSTSVRTLIVDELDEFAGNLVGGDDPVEMLNGRTSAFPATSKRLYISTPQMQGTSRIEYLWNLSDQRRYHVACPDCGHEQPLEWAGLHYTPDGSACWYVCRECGVCIEEHHKTALIAAGRWVPEHPERKIRGYTINCLYYPIGLGPRWLDLVAMWRGAQNDPARLKTFVNDRLAEPWEDPAMRAVKHNVIADRAEPYALRTAPMGVLEIGRAHV